MIVRRGKSGMWCRAYGDAGLPGNASPLRVHRQISHTQDC